MTDTIHRPATAVARPRTSRPGSLVLSGVVSAVGACAVGLLACLCLVVLGWATDPNSTGTSAGLLRSAGHLWLLAHRAPLVVGGDTVTLAPLGLTALLALFVARAGAAPVRRTRARGWRGALLAAVCVGAPYALVVAVVAGATRTAHLRPQPLPALGCAFALAVLAVVAGAVWRGGWGELTRQWPAPARAVPAAVAAATAMLLATGALLVAASLIVDAARVSAIARSVEGAGPAGLALLVVQLTLAPNAALWGSAYAAGTGFAVGVGTHIGPAGVTAGAVPALPLLAALPSAGPAPTLAALSVAGVLAAGIAAGIVLARGLDGTPQQHAALWMVATAVGAGTAFAVLCWLGGGAGPGRLAPLGPAPLVSGVAVAQWIALSGVPAAWVTSWRRARRAAP